MKRLLVVHAERLRGYAGGLLFMLIACLALTVSANATGPMDIYRLAVQNDPTFRSYEFQTKIAKEGSRQALAALLPSVVGTAGYNYKQQDTASSKQEVFGGSFQRDYKIRQYAVTLTQPIFRWDSFVGMQQADVVQARSMVEYTQAGQDLIARVADLYFQALAAQDQVRFSTIEEDSVAKHFELAQERLDMGLIPITDLYDAKARLASTQAERIDAQNKLDDALQALSELTGAPVDGLVSLQVDIDLSTPVPADLESWIMGALDHSPSIELRKKGVEVARLEIERQTSKHYPSLDLVSAYENEKSNEARMSIDSTVDTWSAGLQLSMPFYQGGATSSQVRSARHALSVAQQELIKENRFVQRNTRAAFLGVNSALKRIKALEQSMEASRLALESKQEGFKSGVFTSLNVLDAERDLSLVSINHAQAYYDCIVNGLRLKQAVGSLAEQDLQEIEQLLER